MTEQYFCLSAGLPDISCQCKTLWAVFWSSSHSWESSCSFPVSDTRQQRSVVFSSEDIHLEIRSGLITKLISKSIGSHWNDHSPQPFVKLMDLFPWALHFQDLNNTHKHTQMFFFFFKWKKSLNQFLTQRINSENVLACRYRWKNVPIKFNMQGSVLQPVH